MRFFTCVLDPQGLGLGNRARHAYEALPRQRGLHYEWQCFESAAVLTGWDDPYGDPLVAHDGDWIAAGMVRLDNRPEIEKWVHRREKTDTDLELVLRVVERYGSEYVSKLLGDFAFVAWNIKTRSGIAACDTFAVRRLYWSEHGRFLAFASRAEALALKSSYEVQYLAELISLHDHARNLSVYAGVMQLPRATLCITRGNRLIVERYWQPERIALDTSQARTVQAEHRAVEECQHLLAEAVRASLSGDGDVWAQLSGGLDSSSVTSVAQWLEERGSVAHGLTGTVTFVDHHGTGTDERRYSDSVVARWCIRNEVIVDPPTFYDERYPLPRLDQPRSDLHVYPREMRMCHTVRSAGGRMLLTGVGGDELFSGNMLFFADWLARGRLWPTVWEIARRAALGRVSFWELAYRNAVLPLLPAKLHRHLVREQNSTPVMPWLKRDALKQCGIEVNVSITASAYRGPRGDKYRHAVISMAARVEAPSSGSLADDFLEVRHPLLYRPLVEFSLRLPPELRARPHAQRWVLREAMRGILPELVRTRVGKPGTADYLGWTFLKRQRHLAPLLDEPILADLGLINPIILRNTFNDTLQHPAAGGHMLGPLLNTLAVEAWLQHRCGRWPRDEQATESRITGILTKPSLEGEQRRSL